MIETATATADRMPQAILLQDVEPLGEKGTVIDVSSFARNVSIRVLSRAKERGRDRVQVDR